jgi:hypothetical protein
VGRGEGERNTFLRRREKVAKKIIVRDQADVYVYMYRLFVYIYA